jgi:hypothetical protein
MMISLRLLAAAALAVTAAACNQSEPTGRTEEGLYGASSGPNPNLADLREESPVDPAAPADPATQGENAYPSQTGLFSEPSTGAEGGRSSARTGSTDDGPG